MGRLYEEVKPFLLNEIVFPTKIKTTTKRSLKSFGKLQTTSRVEQLHYIYITKCTIRQLLTVFFSILGYHRTNAYVTDETDLNLTSYEFDVLDNLIRMIRTGTDLFSDKNKLDSYLPVYFCNRVVICQDHPPNRTSSRFVMDSPLGILKVLVWKSYASPYQTDGRYYTIENIVNHHTTGIVRDIKPHL